MIRYSFLFASIFLITAAHGDTVVVSEFYATIRVLPHGDAHNLGIVKKGAAFKVISHEGEWFHIEYKNLPAWVNAHYVVVVSPQNVSRHPVAAPEIVSTVKNIQPALKTATFSAAETIQPQQNRKSAGSTTGRAKNSSGKNQQKTGKSVSLEKANSPVGSSKPEGIQQPSAAAESVSSFDKKEEESSLLPLFVILLILGLGLVVSLYLYFAKLDLFQRRGPKKRSSPHTIDSVIIGRTEKRIHNLLTNADSVLAHYLVDLGCKVHHFTEIANAQTFLQRYAPDVVVVDWQLQENVQAAVESIFFNSKLKLNMAVIFYNVADLAVKRRSNTAGITMEYLGISVSDQDLSKIIAPLLGGQRKEKRFQESVQTSALEGEIQRGSLSEVLQFIEMGRKNGCLYVTENTPLGLIYFEQGRISYAASPAKQGTDAVFELLDLDKGHFHFVMDKVSESRNIDLSVLEIVMEWTKRRDEAGKAG